MLNKKEKGEIIKAGYIDENGKPQNWIINCRGNRPAIEVLENGEALYGGYTIKELSERAGGLKIVH